MSTQRRHSRPLVFLLSLAFLTHLALWFYGENSPHIRKTADSNEYLRAATNLLQRGTVYCGAMDSELKPSLFSRRSPGYPTLIAFLGFFARDPGLIVLVQVLLNFLGAYLIWRILGFQEIKQSVTMLVVALYLFYPAQLIYSHVLMAEILLQVVLLASFFFLMMFLRTKNGCHLAACNLLLGLAPLVKPIMVYFWLPNLLFLAWLSGREGKSKLVLLGLIPVIFVTFWSYRNYIHTGYFHFSSIRSSNMLQVNIRSVVRRSEGRDKANQYVEDLELKAGQAQSFAEASRTVEAAFFDLMIRNWRLLVPAYARGSLFFFLDPGRFDLYQFMGLPHNFRGYQFLRGTLRQRMQKLSQLPAFALLYLSLVGIVNLLSFVGFLYFVIRGRRATELKWFSILLVAYVLLIVAPTGLSRFRLAVMPFLWLALPPLLEYFFSLWRVVRNR